MAFEFKKLSDVNAIEEMKDGLNVLVEDSGEIVKIDANTLIPAPATAKVGQVVAVKVVDENGKPTEWEAVDAGAALSLSTIAPESTVEVSSDNGMAVIANNLRGLVEGKEYVVTYDGVKYEYTATIVEGNGYLIIGSGDPFAIAAIGSTTIAIWCSKKGTHTITIEAKEFSASVLPTPDSGYFLITTNKDENYSASNRIFTTDKTYAEVQTEILAGKTVLLRADAWASSDTLKEKSIYNMNGWNEDGISFTLDYILQNGDFYHDCIIFMTNGTAKGKPFTG